MSTTEEKISVTNPLPAEWDRDNLAVWQEVQRIVEPLAGHPVPMDYISGASYWRIMAGALWAKANHPEMFDKVVTAAWLECLWNDTEPAADGEMDSDADEDEEGNC